MPTIPGATGTAVAASYGFDPTDPDFRGAAGLHQGTSAGGNTVFSTTRMWMNEIEDDYGQNYCVYVWCVPTRSLRWMAPP